MITTQGNEIIIDATTERLEGYRLEDSTRAPVIIVFTDQDEPHMVPIAHDASPIPTVIKAKNKEVQVQIISNEEIQSTLASRS